MEKSKVIAKISVIRIVVALISGLVKTYTFFF